MISIIIPVYNGERYIESLFSAFDRQLSNGFELIFVDDGSKDNSYALINQYVGKKSYPVKLVKQSNSGVSTARNTGIKNAVGEYITFVDVDDYVTEDYIVFISNRISKSNVDTLVFQSYRIHENLPYKIPNNPDSDFEVISNLDILKKFISNPTKFAVYNIVVRRDIIEKNNLYFANGYKYYEDYDYLLRLFCVSQKIEFTERMLYFYILREASAMATFNTARLSCQSLLEDLKPYISEKIPEFSSYYEKWMISRINWSIMWQACNAFSFSELLKFSKKLYMKRHMRNLYDYPDKKVSITARFFCLCRSAYILLAKLFSRSHTKVGKTSADEFFKYLDSLPKEILVFGMTDNKGGIESYLMNMFRCIDPKKIRFDFIVDWKKMAYDKEVLEKGSKIYYIPSKSSHPLKHLIKFFKILKDNKQYKTVYFNILNAGVAYSMVIPFLLRRRIVVHSHNGSDDNMRLHRFFMKPLSFFADRKLACSELAAEHMFGNKAVEKGEVTIINNAISVEDYIFNPERRLSKRQELGLDSKLTVLHVGRITNQKNPMYLLDIFEQLLKSAPDAVLLYAGVGDMEDEVKNSAKEKGIAEKISFLGVRDDISELMQAADAFLLPSKYEGLPIVAIEAQTADLQCFLSESISSEVKITENVHFFSIDASPSVWSDGILKYCDMQRKDRSPEITSAGYNIKNEADKLSKLLQ